MFGAKTISTNEVIMKIFYFEITPQFASPTVVAIFAKSADSASAISGRLMLNIECYEPKYSGAGLALFQQSGNPEQLSNALTTASDEGLGGYTLEDGWTVVAVDTADQGDRAVRRLSSLRNCSKVEWVRRKR